MTRTGKALMIGGILAGLALTMCSSALAGGGGGSSIPTITNIDGSVQLRVGQYFRVRLLDNSASTGYKWLVGMFPSNGFRIVSKTYTPPANPQPGAAGIKTVTFQVLARGKMHLTFQRVRPETGDRDDREHVLTVYAR